MSNVREQLAHDAVAITPANTPSDATWADGLYVGGAGDVTVITNAGTTTTYPSVPAGSHLFVKVRTVKSTGTTATGIVGYRA